MIQCEMLYCCGLFTVAGGFWHWQYGWRHGKPENIEQGIATSLLCVVTCSAFIYIRGVIVLQLIRRAVIAVICYCVQHILHHVVTKGTDW